VDQIPPIRALLAFEAVARSLSFSKAAEELNLTTSAISHQIANLEHYIGRKLFDRTSRGVTLTSAGERFSESIAGALVLISNAAEHARSDDVEILRIHVPPSFATLWLMPRLEHFLHTHQDLRIRLSVDATYSDFSRGEVDLDIRYGAIHWRDLHVETIFSEEIMPLVSPSLKARLKIEKPEDLLLQTLILSEVNVVQWPQWFAAHGVSLSPSEYALRFDRSYLALDAAAQSLGVAFDSARLGERLIEKGALVPVFKDKKAIRVHSHHLVYPEQHGRREKVARFVRWIREQVKGARHQVRPD
jgi:LysR family glycine cleavage system transcriptional activator